jgi:iron(III) transport system substrate-binding protein
MRLGPIWFAAALALLFFALTGGFVGTIEPSEADRAATDAWMRQAGLGPYRAAEDDWAAIEAAAKLEGEVVVYSLSSRINSVGKTFTERYGIKVRAFDMGTADILEKATREQASGVFNADVFFVGDPSVTINEFQRAGHVVNFVPSELVPLLEPAERDQLLYHHFGAKVLMYNPDAYPNGPGVDTLWDLTRPEWKGRLTMKDPLKSPENLDFLASTVKNAAEMEALYELEFGEKLVTSEPNAGYEFLKRLLANSPALTSGDDETAKAIGEKGRPNPPLGIIGASKIRLVREQGLSLAFLKGIKPASGVTYPALLGIANRAPHPNAAKLMVRWMMGDEKGGLGYAPYYVSGDYPSRSDVPLPPDLPPADELGVWRSDPIWLYNNALVIRDYWIANGGTSKN